MGKTLSGVWELERFCKEAQSSVAAILVQFRLHEKLMERLAEKMSDSHLTPVVVYLYGSEREEFPFPICELAEAEVSSISGPDVIVFVDSGLQFPTDIPVVSIPHAFISNTEGPVSATSLSHFSYLLLTSDYLFLPNPETASITPDEYRKEWGNLFPSVCARREGVFTIIPGGYLKADLLLEEIEARGEIKDSILVAPTTIAYGRDGYYQRCCALLDAAFAGTRDETVLFRPYPDDLESPEVLRLVGTYGGNPRFLLDRSPTNIEVYSRAKVLLTDDSLTRFTFSMATGLPYIRHVLRVDQELVEHDLGFDAFTPSQVDTALAHCLSSEERGTAHMRAAKLLNPGTAYECLIDSLEGIVDHSRRDYWISFAREYAAGDWGEPETWYRHLSSLNMTKGIFRQIQGEARARFPESSCFSFEYDLEPLNAVTVDYERRELVQVPYKEILYYLDRPESLPSYAIWGTGQNYLDNYSELLQRAPGLCLGFVDGNPEKWNQPLEGKQILSPQAMLQQRPEIVFIASYAVRAIAYNLFCQLETFLRP